MNSSLTTTPVTATKRKSTGRQQAERFWEEVWRATNRIEEVNNDETVDPYDSLVQVQAILDELECVGTFATGSHTTEAVCLIVAVVQAINGVTWDRFLNSRAAE